MQVVWNYKKAHIIFQLEQKFAETFVFPWKRVNMHWVDAITFKNGLEKHLYVFEKGEKSYVVADFVKW